MTDQTNITRLQDLIEISYIDTNGQIPEEFQGKIGVYGIFNRDQILQFVGYSRDIYISLRQHLVRQPDNCHWVKAQTIERPSRAILETIEKAWIVENASIPAGNGDEKEKWTQPINAKAMMTTEEIANFQNPIHDELGRMKILKNVARRVEAEILEVLAARGLQMQIRFNPKLKEEGLLDLKS
jgi:hypothetical protein